MGLVAWPYYSSSRYSMDSHSATLVNNNHSQQDVTISTATAKDNIFSTYVLEIDWSQIQVLDGQPAVLEFQLEDNGLGQCGVDGNPIIVELHLNEVAPVAPNSVPVIFDNAIASTVIPSNNSNEGLCVNFNKRNVIPILPLGLIPKLTGEQTSAILNCKQHTKSKNQSRARNPKIKSETKDKNTGTTNQENEPKKCKQKLTKGSDQTHQSQAVNGKPASRQPVPCPQCSKVFSSAHSLKRHAVSHSDDPSPFKCGECSKSFTQGAALLVHKREMHVERNVSHPCAFCPKKFRRRRVLKAHIVKVHSPQPQPDRNRPSSSYGSFECLECSAKFRYRQDLTRHRSTHTGEKPHNCPHCPRSFRLAYNLREHIGGHLGERKFQSKYCQRSFRQKYLLQKHERRHEEEGICKSQPSRSLCCRECSATFPTRLLCNQHILLQHQASQYAATSLSEFSDLSLTKCL